MFQGTVVLSRELYLEISVILYVIYYVFKTIYIIFKTNVGKILNPDLAVLISYYKAQAVKMIF